MRVVVWSTGGVGAIAIDAINRRPDLELVGVWVHSPDKVGKDAGELAGGAPLGVAATNDADALIAFRIRVVGVLFTPALIRVVRFSLIPACDGLAAAITHKSNSRSHFALGLIGAFWLCFSRN